MGQQILTAQELKVSDNKKYLQRADGSAFLWLGDTAWELFHKLNREDALLYLNNRAEKGFTVIQAVVLAELDGLKTPNAYGSLPLIDLDPSKPNEAYFEHVDFIVDAAQKLGLIVGVLPTWGDKVTSANGGGPVIFNESNAQSFGEFLGKRYKDKPIVWILGGDRNVANETEQIIWRAMAQGLKDGDEGKHLISYHPRGGSSSHQKLHNEPWLDFNMYQSGHSNRYTDVYRYAEVLLDVKPLKPFVDAEPAYEDIAVEFWKYLDWNNPLRVPADVLNSDNTIAKREYFSKGFFTDHDVRVHAYWNFLSGVCGYTYGTNAIWQMFEKGQSFAIPCFTDWRGALDLPGASQIKYIRKLFEQYSFEKLVPSQNLMVGKNTKDSTHVRAAMANDGSFALVYLSVGQPVTFKTEVISTKLKTTWFNPRNGQFVKFAKIKNKTQHTFIAPSAGVGNDWLLIVEPN